MNVKIYVIGSGGVGGYFGGKLALAGNDVTFLARGDHYEVIKEKGLTVNTLDGNFVVNPAKVINSIDEIKDPDLVIFGVKTYDTKQVADQLSTVVNPETIIITFQNGVENDLEIKKSISNSNVQIYPGVAYIISTKVGPGVINQTGGLKKLIFGDRSGKVVPALQEIEGVMKHAGIDTVLSDDIVRDMWKKYIFVSAFAGFTAMCRSEIGAICADKVVFEGYKECVRECTKVAQKLKVNLPETIFDDVIEITQKTVPSSKSSLLVDIENNRKNEIETLNGTLVRLAQENDVSVPINKCIYCAIKLLQKGNLT